MKRQMGWLGLVAAVLLLTGQARALVGTANEISLENATIGLVDPLIVAKGGTGLATLTDRAVILGRGTAAVEFASPGNAGQVLLSAGAAANPVFGAVDLADTDARTGTLPAGNGGTGQTAATEDATLVANGTVFVATVLPTCSAGTSALTYNIGTNAFGCNTITAVSAYLGFSSLGDVCTGTTCGASNTTVYAVPGAVDVTEGRGQVIAPIAMTLNNLRCVSSVAPGATEDFTITMRDGVCTGALTGSANQVCVISGTNRSCSVAAVSEAVTAGECLDWQVVGSNGATNGVVTCLAQVTG